MASSKSNGGGKKERLVPPVCFAAALAVAAWVGGADCSQAAGLAAQGFAAREGIVLAQTSSEADKRKEAEKKAESEQEKTKKPKRRAIRCGGPGLPECPM